MNTIVATIVAGTLGWSGGPVSAPYGLVNVGQAAVISSGQSTVEIDELVPYAPYSLTCQHTVESVIVQSPNGPQQIKVHRC